MLRDLKGPDVFIRALAALRSSGHDVGAHIFGAGDDADSYHALVAELELGEIVAFHEPTPAREAFATGRGARRPLAGRSRCPTSCSRRLPRACR